MLDRRFCRCIQQVPLITQGFGGQHRRKCCKDEEEEVWSSEWDVQSCRLDPSGWLAGGNPQCGKHLLVQCCHPGEGEELIHFKNNKPFEAKKDPMVTWQPKDSRGRSKMEGVKTNNWIFQNCYETVIFFRN